MRYIGSDITKTQAPGVIAHGVNCQNTMGAGVAKALYTKWPMVKRMYHDTKDMTLGNVQFVEVESDLVVANCFTQQYYGREPGVQYADAEAVAECMTRVSEYASIMGVNKVFIPRIGCGLGGLDWTADVVPTLRNLEITWPLEFVVCDLGR